MSFLSWLFTPVARPPVKGVRIVVVPDMGKPRSRWNSGVSKIFAGIWILIKNLTLVVGALALFLFLFPGLYREAVRFLLPDAFYQIGSLGDPSTRFDERPNWNVDLAPLDGAPKGSRLAKFFTTQPMIARLGKDAYLIGRSDPAGTGDEYAGRSWQGGQCLFINDFEFRAMRRSARYKTDPSGLIMMEKLENLAQANGSGNPTCAASKIEPDKAGASGKALLLPTVACPELPKIGYRPVLEYDAERLDQTDVGKRAKSPFFTIKASAIIKRAGGDGETAANLYVNGLLEDLARAGQVRRMSSPALGPTYNCDRAKLGAVCPRVEIWAIGAVASCSINPFAK